MPKNAHYVHLVSISKEEDIFAMSQYSEFHEDNEHNDIVCYDRFSSLVGTENRGGSEVRGILTTAYQEFSGCAHCCAGKPKRREQDRASPRRRGRA